MRQLRADTTAARLSTADPKPSATRHDAQKLIDRTNQHVSAQVREHRIMRGLTQAQLGKLLGITYQQVHKYETGINRISAGRLQTFAEALKVEVTDFFSGLDGRAVFSSPEEMSALAGLMRDVGRMEAPSMQEAVCRLVRVTSITGSGSATPEEASQAT